MEAGAPILGHDAIPGDPGELQALCARLASTSHQLADLRTKIGQQTEGNWAGHASDAYRGTLGQIGFDFTVLESSFESVANAIRSFAPQLEDFQSTAVWLAQKISQCEEELSSAQARAQTATSGVLSARAERDAAVPGHDLAVRQAALDHAVSDLRGAEGAVENAQHELAQLRHSADENRQQYEDAATRLASAVIGDADFARIRSQPQPHCAPAPSFSSPGAPDVDTDPDDFDPILDYFDL
jgi:uncharacterized protein YukE